MRRSNSINARIRAIEEGEGTGQVTLGFGDGSKQSFVLRRNDRLKVLIAALDIAYISENPGAQTDSTPRAKEVARLIGEAEQITPASKTFHTIAGLVRQAKCTLRAPDLPSGSFCESEG